MLKESLEFIVIFSYTVNSRPARVVKNTVLKNKSRTHAETQIYTCHTDINIDTLAHIYTQIHIQTHTETYTHRHSQIDMHIDTHMYTHRHTHTDTHPYTQTHT